MAGWLSGAGINRDSNLRLQYLRDSLTLYKAMPPEHDQGQRIPRSLGARRNACRLREKINQALGKSDSGSRFRHGPRAITPLEPRNPGRMHHVSVGSGRSCARSEPPAPAPIPAFADIVRLQDPLTPITSRGCVGAAHPVEIRREYE